MNYKIPIFLLPEEVTLDIAERLIAYRQKISQEYLAKNDNKN
jgi:hypothetical protein